MAGSPGGTDVRQNPRISSSKLRVECEDIQGKAAGRNADPLGKGKSQLISPQVIRLVSFITTVQ